MGNKILPPWIGTAFNPEDFPVEFEDQDILLMTQAGINIVRLGEHLWSKIEHHNGIFNFEWLRKIIKKLNSAGIAVMMCIPAAVPPSWLAYSFPEIFALDTEGNQIQHRFIRYGCHNNSVYKKYSERFVREIAREFSSSTGIIGWMISDDYFVTNQACFCQECERKFQKWLEQKYDSIEELNRIWNLEIRNLEYKSFSQIIPPKFKNHNHPQLFADWARFQYQSHAEFVKLQIGILREEGIRIPIGSNMTPIENNDNSKKDGELQYFKFYNYDSQNSFCLNAFWMDYFRNLNENPVCIIESSAAIRNKQRKDDFQEKGFYKINTWSAYAAGGEAFFNKFWRSHWYEQEYINDSIISCTGRPTPLFNEIREISKNLQKAQDLINETTVTKSKVALHFSREANLVYQSQSSCEGATDYNCYARTISELIYSPLMEAQLRPDVLDISLSIEEYKVVITSFLPCIEDKPFYKNLNKWIENGGIWVVGPQTDIRNASGTKYTDFPYGILEKLAGIHCQYQVSEHSKCFNAVFHNGIGFSCSISSDGFVCLEGTKSLANYVDGPLQGLSAITYKNIGKGGVVVLGTMPSKQAFVQLILDICDSIKIFPAAQADSNLLVIPRKGNEISSLICIEYKNRPATLRIKNQMMDLLTGKVFSGKVNLEPYDVMVLMQH